MTKFDEALEYAIKHIVNWKYKKDISVVYLYGSCARNEQNADSDVDLSMTEVEFKFGFKGCLDGDNLFYRNIKRDGIILWKKKLI